METFIVILVLLVLIVLFGGVGYFFIRETGWENARLWITGPRQIRQMMSPSHETASRIDDATYTGRYRDAQSAEFGPVPVTLDDTALRNLREELHGELTRAAGLTRDFDARLTRIEEDLVVSKQLPDEIGKTVQESVQSVEERTQKHISRMQDDLHAARVADSPFGQRRADALAELYANLAHVETALSNVVNPMLLPGEPLRVPDELFEDTLDWENWDDVGERAYSLGDVFNRDRIVLEPELAEQIERFLSTFRQALTEKVSPVVQNPSRTSIQINQMKAGLTMIVTALPPLRRQIEAHYRACSATPETPGTDE